MGNTGVIKEALTDSFLLRPGLSPFVLFSITLSTTSRRSRDAWNAAYAFGSRASSLKIEIQYCKCHAANDYSESLLCSIILFVKSFQGLEIINKRYHFSDSVP